MLTYIDILNSCCYQSWIFEESFKIAKSVLGARPVYLNRRDHNNAHFLICLISLILARLVEIRLNNKYLIKKIIESLRSVSCSHIDKNHYLLYYADEITDDMNVEFNLNFGKKVMTLGEIKKNLQRLKR
jgi:transposase